MDLETEIYVIFWVIRVFLVFETVHHYFTRDQCFQQLCSASDRSIHSLRTRRIFFQKSLTMSRFAKIDLNAVEKDLNNDDCGF